MNLYQLSDQLRAIQNALDDGDGEITPEAEALLNSLEEKTGAKIDGCCKMVQEYRRRAEAAKAERDRLALLAESNEIRAESLKRYVMACLEKANCRRWSTDFFDVSICKNSRPSIRYAGMPEMLPEDLQRHTVAFDNQRAYELWKEGVELPESISVEQGQHLRIR